MPRKCSVQDCHSTNGFKFPRNPKILKRWKRALNIHKTKHLNERCIVCIKHFTPDDFVKISKYTNCELIRKQLIKDAVPTLFLPKQDNSLYGEISDEEPEQMTAPENPGVQKPLEPMVQFFANADAYDHFLTDEIFSDFGEAQQPASAVPPSTSVETVAISEPSSTSILVPNKSVMRVMSTQTDDQRMKSVCVQTFRVGFLSYDAIKTKKGGITYFTGLKCSDIFELILEKLNPSPSTLIYKYHKVNNVTDEDQFLITLVKLRKVTPDFELSVIFDTSNKSIQNIFTSWINFMYNQLIKRKDLWSSDEIFEYFGTEDYNGNYRKHLKRDLYGQGKAIEKNTSQKLSDVQKTINLSKFTYKILRNPLPNYYNSIGDRIFMVCCFLADFKFENFMKVDALVIKNEQSD